MRWKLAASAIAAVLAVGGEAGAFCRAHGCDPKKMQCIKEDGCVVTGPELFWRDSCVTVGVHGDASARNEIDYDAFDRAVRDAFTSWESADCGAGAPRIHFDVIGPVDRSLDSENTSIVLFRDDEWPYVGGEDELGQALITYDTESGEIAGVDIEINGTQAITLDASNGGNDLASVLTHEAGHFLGLDHTTVEGATMVGRYQPDLATLEPDDVAGICKIYPPGAVASTESCDYPERLPEVPYCSATPGRRGTGGAGAALLILGASAAALSRRRREDAPSRAVFDRFTR